MKKEAAYKRENPYTALQLVDLGDHFDCQTLDMDGMPK